MKQEEVRQFLGKQVRVEAQFGERNFIYHGPVTALTEDGLWLEDRYTGLTFIRFDTIRFLSEWHPKEVEKDG